MELLFVSASLCIVVTIANVQKIKATPEIIEKLKEAYALLVQGQPKSTGDSVTYLPTSIEISVA
ncbi:MAG: hypothetical protein ACK40X_00090 [Armatimonadota bacterium]